MKKTIVIMVVGVSILTLAFVVYTNKRVEMDRDDLFNNPTPLPKWINATGPQPGESLAIKEAVYIDEPPFEPAIGNICVQLNNFILDLPDERLLKDIQLFVDGHRVLRPRAGILIHGVVVKDGLFIIYNDPHQEHLINYCLAMQLNVGEHLVMIRVRNRDLLYSWSFQLTK